MTGKRWTGPIPKGKPKAKARRRPIAHRSAKRQAAREAEEETRLQVFRRDGGCVLRHQASHRCTGPETPHHLHKASAGGRYVDDNMVCLCAGGNTAVEDDPPWGRWVGLVVRFDITPGEAWDRRRDCGLIVRTERPEV